MKIMHKILFIITLLGGGIIYAQDNLTNKHFKELSFFMEGNSGTLVNNTDGQFSGNEFIMGIKYQQNFIKVSWLSMYMKLAAKGTINFNRINLNQYLPTGTQYPKYQFNGYKDTTLRFDYLETGLLFSKWGSLAVRQNFLIKAYGYMPIKLSENQLLKLLTGVEFVPFFIGTIVNPADPNLKADGTKTHGILDLLQIGIEYHVGFAKGWSFTSGAYFRTSGNPYELPNSATGNIWNADTKEALRNNINIRWDNILAYTHDNGLSIWGAIRYQADRIAVKGLDDLHLFEGRPQHDIYLRFGLSYTLDFVK